MRHENTALAVRLTLIQVVCVSVCSYLSIPATGAQLQPSLDSARQYHEQGITRYKEKKYLEAVQQFQKAIEADPENEAAYRMMVDACRQVPDSEYAGKFFSALTVRDPDNPFPYYALGRVCLANGDYQEALTYFKKSVLITGAPIPAYRDLAYCHRMVDSLTACRDFLQELVASRPKDPGVCFGLAWALKYQWHSDTALQAVDSALLIDPGLLAAYALKASILFDVGDLESALAVSLQGLALAQERQDKEAETSLLGTVGAAYLHMDDPGDAITYTHKAVEMARELGDKRAESSWLGNLCVGYMYAGNLADAISCYQETLEINRELDDKVSEGMTLGNMGNAYAELGEWDKALEYHFQGLSIARQVHDRRSEVVDLSVIGAILGYMTEYDKALAYTDSALALERELGLKSEESDELGNIGLIHYEQGHYSQALKYFHQALGIATEAGDRGSTGQWLLAIGSCYYDLDTLRDASDYIDSSIVVFQETGQKIQEARSLSTKGLIQRGRKDDAKALECFEEGLAIFAQAGAQREHAISLANIAVVLTERGEYSKAIDLLGEALRLNQEMGSRFHEGETYNSLGVLYAKQKRYEDAIKAHEIALSIGRQISARKTIWEAHFALATIYEEQKDLSEASDHYRAAIETIENIRWELSGEQDKLGFFSGKVEVYKRLQHLLFRLHKGDPDGGFAAEAFKYAERARARVLLDLLSESRLDIVQRADTALLRQEGDVFKEIARMQMRLRGEGLSEAEIDELVRDLGDAEKRVDRLRAEMREKSPAYASLKFPEPVELKHVQTMIPAETDIILEFSLGDTVSFLWVVTAEDCQMYPLESAEEIGRRAEEYLQVIGQPPHSTVTNLASGKALYDMLLAPAERELKHGSRLVIVPDGVLCRLPFEALISRFDNDAPRYLLESFRVAYAPSVSSLELLLTGEHGLTERTQSRFLAFGNPLFGVDADSADFAGVAERGLYESNDFRFAPLPFTEEEVKSVASLYPENLATVYLGNEATEEMVKKIDLAKFQRVHFATHAILDEQMPSRSCVVLTLDNDPAEDGFLQLSEIFNLNLDADLVVLSACQTGLGKLLEGEGLIGLSRGFFYAGARSIALSLWGVNDRSTAQFMRNFYQCMLDGQEKAVALQSARLDFLRGNVPALRHPYYWAPFILMGES